jgi:desulfoferrodoxin (superoxide reductase-like protein)
MKFRKLLLLLPVLLLATQLMSGTARADKASVSIQVPSAVSQGSETVITLTVKHSANNFFHHTEWVYVTVNDKEVSRWSYTASNLPPGGVFTKQIKVAATKDLTITAEASCNLHGSAGATSAKIAVKD